MSPSRIEATSVASACWLGSDDAPVFMPWTVRSRTRCTCAIIDCIVEPVWSSQAWASVMLRACWSTAAWSLRVCMARLVPVGESDGALICLPDVSCCCSLATESRLRLRPWRLVSATARWVIRIVVSAPRARCG